MSKATVLTITLPVKLNAESAASIIERIIRGHDTKCRCRLCRSLRTAVVSAQQKARSSP